MLMVIIGIVPQLEALEHLGQPSLLKIIFLLIVCPCVDAFVLDAHITHLPVISCIPLWSEPSPRLMQCRA